MLKNKKILQLIRRKIILILITITIFANKRLMAQHYDLELKAAHIVMFSKFVKWSATDKPMYVMGIYGNDNIYSILSEMSKQHFGINGWRIFGYNNLDELKNGVKKDNIKVLFVSEDKNITELRAVIDLCNKEKGILTVGNNIPYFCANGGIINFTTANDNKRFKINYKMSQKVELEINHKLIELSEIIEYNRSD